MLCSFPRQGSCGKTTPPVRQVARLQSPAVQGGELSVERSPTIGEVQSCERTRAAGGRHSAHAADASLCPPWTPAARKRGVPVVSGRPNPAARARGALGVPGEAANYSGVAYLWWILLAVGATACLWILIFLSWAFLLWWIVRSGVIRSWDELSPETAELQPFASRRLRFRPRSEQRRAHEEEAPPRSSTDAG